MIRKQFEEWKANHCETEVPLDINDGEMTSSTIRNSSDSEKIVRIVSADVAVEPEKRDEITDEAQNDYNDASILNQACINIEDFDTQMSPLIYSDSDSDSEENQPELSQRIDCVSSNELSSTLSTVDEIVCNQEHAQKILLEAKQERSNKTGNFDKNESRTSRKSNKKTSILNVSNMRVNSKKLPFKNKTNSRNIKKFKEIAQITKSPKRTPEKGAFPVLGRWTRQRSASSTSDVQIISQKLPSPIYISNSSSPESDTIRNDTNIDTKVLRISPDLFCSFNGSAKSIPSSPKKSRNNDGNRSAELTVSIADSPATNNIDSLSNTHMDIFEITKNDVFPSVLCSNHETITPVKDSTKTPSKSCLSGLRIHIERLNDERIKLLQNDLIANSQNEPVAGPSKKSSNDGVIEIRDSQSSQSSDIQIISSSETIDSVQRTPERKRRELSPSTRSCLKRHSDTDKSDDRKKMTPTRTGWLSKKQHTSPSGETPRSRRRLLKWLQKTEENTTKPPEDSERLVKPRKLCDDFASCYNNQKQQTKHIVMSNALACSSPSLFSDED